MTQMNNNDKPIGILKIKPKGKRFLVTFPNDELEITEEIMVRYRISLAKRFTQDEFAELKKDLKIGKSLEKAIGYIAYKMRSKKEVSDYLKKLELSNLEIEAIIKRLEELNFINDETYLKALIEDYYLKLKGTYNLKYDLMLKGFSDEEINYAISIFNEDVMLEELVNKYQHKEEALINHPVLKQKQLLKESMIRKGFQDSTINKVLDNLNYHEDLEDTFLKDVQKIKNKTNDYNKQVAYLMSKGYQYNLIKEHLKK